MPRVPPPCFRKKHLRRQLGCHMYASRRGCRTYAHTPQVGYHCLYLFSSFDMLYLEFLYSMYQESESTARHSSENNENTTENSERKKNPRPLSCNGFLPDRNTLHPVEKKKQKIAQKSLSLSLVRRPPLPRPPRHRFGPGEAFNTLCHNQPRRPARVKPGAHRRRRSPAR